MGRSTRSADPIFTLVWLGVGAAWVVQLFLPWVTTGPLSTSSALDVIRLERMGSLGDLVPAWGVVALLVLPSAGVLMMASAGLSTRSARRFRTLIICSVALCFAVAFVTLLDHAHENLGPGAWMTLLGVVLGAVAVVIRGAEPVA
ncbi:hypothetical protein [Nocardioides sp.]|uniref:hypothetical protein n=1 Tax=Nocardioides sp. TaxID=35761 RepID=UPI003D1245B7